MHNENAPNTIVCFHGFGQKAQDYNWLAKLSNRFKVISINLFFHGNSSLSPHQALSPQDWKTYFGKLIEKESIKTFSIVGYSMGGRFALTTFKHFSHKIERLYLIAPDGLVIGNWYKFATGSHVQRLLFRSVLNSYSTFLTIAKSLSKIGVLNKGLLKFSLIHLQNNEERDRVYNTWTSFRLLKLSPIELNSISTKYKISVDLILGNYDRVIPIKRIDPQLIKSPYLQVKKVSITHNKLFYYNFLERA